MCCGNSVVEDWEQCDCGFLKQCYSDTCCSVNCTYAADLWSSFMLYKLHPLSMWDALQTNPQYMWPPRILPRGSSVGPENTYMQDASLCFEKGYCYHGKCTDHNMHCWKIWLLAENQNASLGLSQSHISDCLHQALGITVDKWSLYGGWQGTWILRHHWPSTGWPPNLAPDMFPKATWTWAQLPRTALHTPSQPKCLSNTQKAV